MKKLEWNLGMSVGVETIDNDHKMLLSLVSRLSDSIEEERTGAFIESVFDELEKYIKNHFLREEDLMMRCGYEGLEEHVMQHREFAKAVPELRQKLLTSDSAEVAMDIHIFLYRWLVHHILVEDMSYTQSVYEKGMADTGIKREPVINRITNSISRRLSFGFKIALASLVPMAGVIGLACVIFLSQYQRYMSLTKLHAHNQTAQEINTATHDMQAERGLSTGYISSEYSSYRTDLKRQRDNTDRSVGNLVKAVNVISEELINSGFRRHVDRIRDLPSTLESLRSTVDQKQVVDNAVKTRYTSEIFNLLSVFESMAHLEMDGELASSNMTCVAVLNLKERLGQERALGTQAIENGFFTPKDFQLFINLIGQRTGFNRTFEQSVTAQQRSVLQGLNTPKNKENVRMAEMRLFEAVRSKSLLEMDSRQWWDTLSGRMDQLEDIADLLVLDLKRKVRVNMSGVVWQFVFTSILLFLVLLFTLAISWILNLSITVPVRRITRALSALGKGQREIRFTETFCNDELGRLVAAYEQCRRALLKADMASAINFRCKDIDLLYQSREKDSLELLASTDPLTGALNRRKFYELAEWELNRTRRFDDLLAFMVLDIDHFKKINDNFGHAIGDIVLQQFHKTCRKIVRDTDILARVGGEEFAVLMPETSLDHAAVMAERLRLAVSALSVPIEHNTIGLTVSIGVAAWDKTSFTVIEDMATQADKALYKAKNTGRNRVVRMGAG